ncbi:RNase adapter RapZ [Streptomyces sp. NBC_00102]|uniref:RapZ C-terminal domain-containing protein n=1 Tax=Streptomyces sp. NBC_00102 TaxID=2975652 RepID=UPI002256C0B1|nr:RNase adapter RapZ [Streptomyces sp. NBC_00102]MCX5400062.1 ATPase [Streptomyces sp. NBC_00102]
MVIITSFGYLHDPTPGAHLVLDLRHHFRDPHVSPELKNMTAHDAPVRAAVLATPGITGLVDAAARAVGAFAAGPTRGDVVVAVGCAGGRHRAPTVARALADRLTADGYTVAVQHRDLHRPVVER